MSLVDSQSPVLLEKVVELIKNKVPSSQSQLVQILPNVVSQHCL